MDAPLAAGTAALEAGRWTDARSALEASLADGETAEACLGLAAGLWWLGENDASVTRCTRAHSCSDSRVERAVQCALWLGITH